MVASRQEGADEPRQCVGKQGRYSMDKGPCSQGFPVVTHSCQSWTVRKAEHQRTDASELWCWRRLLRVPWTPRRTNQSSLREINSEYSLEGLMLKLQYFGHLMQTAITSWEINGEPMETVSDFICGGLQNHCRWQLQP